jgi:hypothetical protein
MVTTARPSSRIYALLVGIDHYPNPAHRLHGCVNDITAFAQYLHQWAGANAVELKIQTLVNESATKAAIVHGLQKHLTQAKAGETALFYYAGHGSQEETPPEFWHLEPDHQNETLVCWDSRLGADHWDLADKELRVLLAAIAHRSNLVVIMDCCHSGHITRDLWRQRGLPKKVDQRPFNTYLAKTYLAPAEALEPNHQQRSLAPLSLPALEAAGQYILLAACQDSETAKEAPLLENESRGLFSYSLLQVLEATAGNCTYRTLFEQTRAAVLSTPKPSAQTPQLELVGSETLGLCSLNRLFLTDTGIIPPRRYLVHQVQGQWTMAAGTIHGIAAPGGRTSQVALFPYGAGEQGQANPIARAHITHVLPHCSGLTICESAPLHPDQVYQATLQAPAQPPFGVYVEGQAAGAAAGIQALRGEDGDSVLQVQAVETLSQATFRVVAQPEGGYRIWTNGSGPLSGPLPASLSQYRPSTSTQLVQTLEHIGRWLAITNLTNPNPSYLSPTSVELAFYQGHGPVTQASKLEHFAGQLEYSWEAGQWIPPTFRLKVTNVSPRPLYCALLTLADDFSVAANVLIGGGRWLRSQESIWALDGLPLVATIASRQGQAELTTSQDILQLIVCTTPFDLFSLEQPGLQATPPPSLPSVRAISPALNPEATAADWFVRSTRLTVVRPRMDITLAIGSGA